MYLNGMGFIALSRVMNIDYTTTHQFDAFLFLATIYIWINKLLVE